MSINLLEDTEHPVKVGLSDAYIIDRTIFCKYNNTSLKICVVMNFFTYWGEFGQEISSTMIYSCAA